MHIYDNYFLKDSMENKDKHHNVNEFNLNFLCK